MCGVLREETRTQAFERDKQPVRKRSDRQQYALEVSRLPNQKEESKVMQHHCRERGESNAKSGNVCVWILSFSHTVG